MLEEIIFALVAGAGGGLLVKIIELVASRSEKKKTAKTIIDKNLDPILKATDDLVGKLYSLQREDFMSPPRKYEPLEIERKIDETSLLYYFANFWGRIQILRRESIYVNLNSTTKGKYLQAFITTLESKRIRILERALQRGIGESITFTSNGQLQTISYYEFVDKLNSDKSLGRWYESFLFHLKDARKSGFAQKILVYGTILNALLSTLDSKRLYAKERRAWPNKLTEKNRKELRFRIFSQYLSFVKKAEQYYTI